MRKLSKFTNIIPILAKSDTFTSEEVIEIKLNFKKSCQFKMINFEKIINEYWHQYFDSQDRPLGSCPPFAYSSPNKVIKTDEGRLIFVRKYTWGTCNIEDPQNSDFQILRKLILGFCSFKLQKKSQKKVKQLLDYTKKMRKNAAKEDKKKSFFRNIGSLLATFLNK